MAHMVRSLPALLLLAPLASAQLPFEEFHRALPANAHPTVWVQVADFDGDGDPDVFFESSQKGLLRNDGQGIFTAEPVYPGAQFSAAGDIDGDGDVDVLEGKAFVNDGTGHFTVHSPGLPTPTGSYTALALGDVDGDGDLDAVDSGDPEDALFLNDGTGSFARVTTLGSGASFSSSVALADLDGDGDLDVVFGSGRIFFGDGAGGFVQGPVTLAVSLGARIVTGDADGDGDLDLFAVQDGQDVLFRNDGSGAFTAPGAIPAEDGAGRAATFFDADGDGDLDLYVANVRVCSECGTGQDELLLNDGGGSFTAAPLPPFQGDSVAVQATDFDLDGDVDLYVAEDPVHAAAFGQDRLYLNDGTGGFLDAAAVEHVQEIPRQTQDLDLADLDGDGDLDLFLTDRVADEVDLDDGDGNFAPLSGALPPQVSRHVASALGDLDGDGDVDALVVGAGPGALYRNRGNAFFDDASAGLPPHDTISRDVALLDVEGDGDLDAYVVSGTGDFLYLNDGSGSFSDASARLPLRPSSNRVAVADVDGDGTPDVWVANAIQDELFLNDGAGGFVSGTAGIPRGGGHEDVRLGDVDGDGDPDALFKGSDGTSSFYRNLGAGRFVDDNQALHFLVRGFGPSLFADWDGDGDLDILLHVQGTVYGLRNDGSGTFREASTSFDNGTACAAMAAGDVDGDGDLDLLLGNDASAAPVQGNFTGLLRLLANTTRHVAWRREPGVEKPFRLEVRGPSRGAWVVAVAAGRASLPLPGHGTLGLDPATLLVAGSGTFDASGEAALVFPASAVPAILDLSLAFQAAVGPRFLLTNVETAVVTPY